MASVRAPREARAVSDTSPGGERPRKPTYDPYKIAVIACCGIFVLAFSTMVVIGVSSVKVPNANVLMDTCEWLVALMATTIAGLITRGR
jgi:hypothetical protein